MSASSRNQLQTLPPEILSIVFGNVQIRDLLSLSLACRKFNETIQGNKMMFRSVYMHTLDDPSLHIVGEEWDWEDEIHNFGTLKRLLSNSDSSKKEKRKQIQFVLNSIVKLARTSNPTTEQSRNVNFIRQQFHQKIPYTPQSNIEALCCQSEMYSRAHKPIKPTSEVEYRSFETRQASAKLHVMLGSPINSMPRDVYDELYPYAISKVYDLRNYTSETLWGPYLPDGKATVDWEKMEAIMIIMTYNIRDFAVQIGGVKTPLYSFEWDGLAPNSVNDQHTTEEMSLKDEDGVEFEDPYNITGSWMRIVTFLDFHELFHYNFAGPVLPRHLPRPAHKTREAVRLIMMELQAVRREEPGPDDGQDYPIIHFTGSAYSLHNGLDPNANSSLTGSVRQTKEGEIRWTTLSVYGGEERWKSECIQVGGINSARGVLGHWFDKDWEQTGPAGPTAFWKFRYTIGEPDEPTADTAEIIPDDENDGDFEIPTDDDDEEEQDESDTEFESMRDEIMQTYAEQIAEAMERRVDVGGGAGVGGGSGGGSSS